MARGNIISGLGQKIEKLEGWFILLSGWSRYLAAFFAGCLTSLAMAPFDLVYVLFLTFPLLVWLIDGASSDGTVGWVSKFLDGFKPGFFFGFGYFLAGLWWIGGALLVDADAFAWALPFAILGVPFILAIFWGCAAGAAHLFWFGNIRRILMLAACFALFEYLRGFVATGFPWNAIGYAAYFNPTTMQSASVFGIYGITALVVIVASLPVTVFFKQDAIAIKKYSLILVWLGLVVSHFGYGTWRLDNQTTGFVDGVQLRLVQPAIDQAKKFDPLNEAEVFQRYLDLSVTEQDGKKLSDVTHLIWPESAFPFLLTERRDALSAIAAMLPENVSLVTGAARAEHSASSDGGSLVFNSAYIVDHEGIIISAADKIHLVPFGEYLPFQDFLESLGIQQLTKVQGGFEAGASRKLLSTGIGPSFLPLICYEIIFSGEIWNENNRPGWMLNLTNDAWYGITPGPYQHERQAIVRAVEEGLPLVRVANSGISGVYNAYGETQAQLELSLQGIIDARLPVAIDQTLHSLYGKIIFWIVFGVCFFVGIVPSRRV